MKAYLTGITILSALVVGVLIGRVTAATEDVPLRVVYVCPDSSEIACLAGEPCPFVRFRPPDTPHDARVP